MALSITITDTAVKDSLSFGHSPGQFSHTGMSQAYRYICPEALMLLCECLRHLTCFSRQMPVVFSWCGALVWVDKYILQLVGCL